MKRPQVDHHHYDPGTAMQIVPRPPNDSFSKVRETHVTDSGPIARPYMYLCKHAGMCIDLFVHIGGGLALA